MMLKITTHIEKKRVSRKTFSTLLIFALLLCGNLFYGQLLVPYSGSNTLTCGSNTIMMDHAGTGNYLDNADGFSVLDAGFGTSITISGTYTTETNYDYIYIYSGAGTGGTLIQTLNGTGTYNFTGTAGQTLTVRFYSDGSVTYAGFDFTVSSSGPCFATPCTGVPGANSVTSPTYAICPNTSGNVGLASTYTVGNLSYQWYSSTFSNLGPYTAVTGATNNAMTTPTLGTQTWYQAVITCLNGGGSVTATPAAVSVQPVTISTVPYHEGFEGIIGANKLPNCSWYSPQLGGTAQTYVTSNTQGRVPHTGNKFASFYYSPAGTNYFYSNGLQLEPGITYSASIWYQTDYYGYNNWSELAIMMGPNQSTTGLVTIASSNGPAISNVYKPLSNTFTVASSGVYYMAVKATANTSAYAYYLTWDDLDVIIPCSLNSPTLGVTATSTDVCEGQSVNLTAIGADTYAWNTGDNGSVIVTTPVTLGMNNITVVGTNTLSGCSSTVSQAINVNPAPEIFIYPSKAVVCAGSPVNLSAFGADTYSWSLGGNSNVLTVIPAGNTSYTVLGSNSYGCIGTGVITISTNPLPNVTAFADRQSLCIGESVVLTAGGANSYEWLSSALFLQNGNPITVSPSVTGNYTVTGMDANGCKSTAVVPLGVDACTGINANTANKNVVVYPNPTTGMLTIEVNNSADKTIEITDLTGRVVATVTTTEGKANVNLEKLAKGIYNLNIRTGNSVEVVKIVKE